MDIIIWFFEFFLVNEVYLVFILIKREVKFFFLCKFVYVGYLFIYFIILLVYEMFEFFYVSIFKENIKGKYVK